MVRAAYVPPSYPVSGEELHGILRSYLIVFHMGIKSSLSGMDGHMRIRRRLASNFRSAHHLQMNPFAVPQFSFEVAAHIVEDLAQDYGKWQNTECRQMQEELTKLDAVGKELVPRSRFWSQPVYSLPGLRVIGVPPHYWCP